MSTIPVPYLLRFIQFPSARRCSLQRWRHFPSSISVLQLLYFAMRLRRTIMYSSVVNRIAFFGSPIEHTQRPILTGEGQAIPVFHPHAHTHTHVRISSRSCRSPQGLALWLFPVSLAAPHPNRMRLEIARICGKFPYDRYKYPVHVCVSPRASSLGSFQRQ